MTIQEKAERIIKDIKKEKGNNPIQIFKKIADYDYINIHGPEHHILDGACLLIAFKNAGGEIDLDDSIEKYTEAMKLVKECDKKLKSIEEKVNKIVLENGNTENFEMPE